jgi:uncharacterized membrane protein
MRAYVITTGAVFGLLAVAHVLRIIREDPGLATTDPFYVAITAAAAGLCAGSVVVLRRIKAVAR